MVPYFYSYFGKKIPSANQKVAWPNPGNMQKKSEQPSD